jgi:hypothetical protein
MTWDQVMSWLVAPIFCGLLLALYMLWATKFPAYRYERHQLAQRRDINWQWDNARHWSAVP